MTALFPVPDGFFSIERTIDQARMLWGAEGEARLLHLLQTGELRSTLITHDGRMEENRPDFWNDRDLVEILFRGFCLPGSATVIVREHDALKSISSKARTAVEPAVPSTAVLDTKAKNKPGAKVTYDEAAFLIEAFRLLYDRRKPPKSQAELVDLTLTAYHNEGLPGGMPSPSWAKPLISKLWKKLFPEG